ncbi:T9SS sorting signal type C domain-containing protein [Flavobacterium sp. Sd200]|uniref:T9SS sorting signal type C domain-containing protein n=1 Tax=Flavobacterium sp. Sd200 TaxID=2692211 RepID=UPI00136ACF97|nr:T9SS sorting signal type C domain-containing protein [Flavobacterium sp. Sd200]MXN92785.1 T9SS sorting signal type C domain-containing protein [Flavobacterium sp. Sd200]
MKNAVLLLMLLPFIGFSQSSTELLARWEGTRINWSNPTATPTYYNNANAGSTASNFTASGVTMNVTYGGFEASSWPTGTTVDYTKYYQVAVTANQGKQIAARSFRFQQNGYVNRYEIRYSKDASFVNNGTLLYSSTNGTSTQNTYINAPFPSGYTVAQNETLYIRIYGYQVDQNNNRWNMKFDSPVNNSANTNGVAPGFYGVISTYVPPVMTAVEDSYTVNVNASTVLNLLSNDGNASSVTGLTITTPSNGTATVNADRTVTYTPATAYTGTDSFSYTITNGGASPASTATVSITVAAQTPTGPLNGTYYVGTNGHFTTLTSAVNYLNTNGIAGPVNFLLKNATYNTNETFPLTINPIANSSATNVVTFKPFTGVSPRIVATNVNNYTGIPAIFYLNGADYITFDGSNTANGTTKNLTLDNQDYIDYIQRSVFWVASNGTNGATHITVKNCNIKQSVVNQGGKFSVGVYSGNNGTGDNNTMNVAAATANNSDLTVTNNDFMSVKQGVYINGTSSLTTNVVVNRNDLGATTNAETIISPATFINVNGFEYSDNLVNNLYRSTDDGNLVSAGIYVAGASKNGSILRNTLKDLTRTVTNNQAFGGIVLASTDFNSNILVANNFILNVAAQGNGGGYLNGYGIIADNGGGYKIYHNTVVLNTNQPNGGFSAALYVNTAARNLDVRNNIFSNNQTNTATRRSAIMVLNYASNVNSIFTNLDYNDYYSNDRLGYITNANTLEQANWPGNGVPGSYQDNADYTYTLQAWKSVTGKDAHSVNVNPGFASATDLHINANNSVNDVLVGTPVNITRDIDNQLRSTTAPKMGADEFGPVTSMPTAGNPTGIYCDSATTWNGTAWSNGEPTAEKDVIFSGNFTQTGGTFYACSIFVLNGASVNFMSNSNTIVTHSVNVAETGALTFESSSNLLQLGNDANSGTTTVKRNSSRLKRLDYTMWTAPVVDSRTTGYQTLLSFSPATTIGRFYQYSTAEDQYNIVSETSKFARGKAYLIRMPNSDATPGYNAGTTRISYAGVFTGTPNNGEIKSDLSFAGSGYNAIGNPYPSPISVQDFINANLNVIEGTIWIWRKTNNSTVSSYSTVNLTGYTANAALGGGGNHNDGNDLIADPYAIDPRGSLNTAQGFIVKAKAANLQATFKNSMRIQTNSNTFFRTAAPSENTATVTTHRLWLNASNEAGEFSQMLIGYNDASTLGYDNGYDGAALVNGNLNLYSVLETETDTLALTIQARGTFAEADRVKLGYTSTLAGTFTISKDHADGLFEEGQTVYLIDNLTGDFHNLNESNYTFTTEAGTYNGRFAVAYATDEQLGTDKPVVETKATVVYKNGKQISVNAPAQIKSVEVYDMLGKTIFGKNNVDNTEFSTNEINVAPQVLIVKVTLENKQVVSKKIMMN